MICKKAMKIAMGVGMVLCATASFAEVTENFEGTIGAGWSDGTSAAVVEDNSQYGGSDSVGYPISGDHTKILNVEGEVSCTNSPDGTPTSSISDFLIFIPEPSDELDDEGLTDAKIAIAAGTTESNGIVPLCLYCTTNGTNKGWGVIGSVSTGTWVRVTLAFTNGFCRVSINGEPAKSSYGYPALDSGSQGNGAWYKLAGGTGNSVQSLAFIGCAKLDDVVIKDSFADNAFSATAVAKLNRMTVGEKLLCGLDPTTETKFEPVSITKTSAAEATITFPCDDPTKTGRYKIEITGGTCNNANVVAGAITNGCEAGRAKITLTGLNQTAPVMTFKLVAEK